MDCIANQPRKKKTMNIKKLFGGSEVITSQERQKLEALDASCKELRDWLEKIPQRLPTNQDDRNRLLNEASEEFAKKPTEASFRRILEASWNPVLRAKDDFEAVTGALNRQINERMHPQQEMITEILKRHLSTLEKKHEITLVKEQKESLEYGLEFKASGIIRGLEAKIMELRNRIFKGEHGHWRDALAELL